MDYKKAYSLFDTMIQAAKEELVSFTLSQPFFQTQKADKSLVTECDKAIDAKLSAMASSNGLQVISEEGEHALSIVGSGNYITIDPIDGTLGYIDYVNTALQEGGITKFLQRDLGPDHDMNLLLGIVEQGIPQYGALYNYVTGETIYIDANDKDNFIRKNNVRNYSGKFAVYSDKRPAEELEESLKLMPDVTVITQATLGLKWLYTLINPHESAVTVHLVQNAGIWDIMPAAVAARLFGGNIYDSKGRALVYTSYIVIPPTGVVIIKGEKFQFILDILKLNTKKG